MSTVTRGLNGGILTSPSGSDLSQALNILPASDRRALEAQLGTASLRELESLSRETDRELFAEGMLRLGQGLEAQDCLNAAVTIYQGLASAPEVGDRAQGRLQAIVGGGALGPRAEFLLRQLTREVIRPEPLAAMAVAGLAFRVVRLGTLSRLLARPSSGILTSGIGARWVAGSAGFLAEGTAFALTQKGLAQALGHSSDWGPNALGRDLASSLLVLGGLRIGGLAANTAYRRTLGLAGTSTAASEAALHGNLLHGLFNQTGMLGGILLSHRLEEWAGLRAPSTHSGAIDSLVTLLHFNLVGNLSRRLMGAGFREMEMGLDLQAQRLSARPTSRPWTDLLGDFPAQPRLAWATGTSRPGVRSRPEPRTNLIFMMGNQGDGEGPGRRRTDNNSTLPFAIRALDAPLAFENIHQVIRQLHETERLRFPERLAQGDVLIKVFEDVSDSSRESFRGLFLDFLNITASRHPVIDGRLVEFQIGMNPIWNFVKVDGVFRFETPEQPLPRAPAVAAAPEPSPASPRPPADHLRTLPFGVTGQGRDPLTSIMSVELLRRIRNAEYHFDDYLRGQDVQFTLEREDAFDAEGFLRILARDLDKIPNVPLGRSVSLRLEPSQNRLVLEKTAEGFRPPSPPGPGILGAAERARLGSADTIIARPEDLAEIPDTRPPPSPPPSGRGVVPTRQPLENPAAVPLVIRDLSQLTERMNWALANRLEGEHPVALILELPRGAGQTHPITAEGLQGIAPRLNLEAPQPMFFDLAVPALREVFIAEIRGSALHWRKGSNHFLTRSAIQIFSHRINAQSSTALYQILEAFSRETERAADQEITLHYSDVYPRSSLLNFQEFIRQSLNGTALRGRLLRVEFENGERPLVFENSQGLWGLPEGGLRVAGNQLDLRSLIHELLDPQSGSGLNVFLERRTVLTTPEIRRLVKVLETLSEGRRLRLHDLKGRKTVTFERRGEALDVDTVTWDRPEDFANFSATNLTEVIQRLSFLRGLVMPKPHLHVEFQAPGSLEPQLPTFLEVLNRWSWFPPSTMEVRMSPSGEAWRFQKEIGGWRAERIPPP